jgi:hypothetical protein
MSELWIAIGIVTVAFVLSLVALSYHKRIGAESSPETLKNTVEVMKLCGLFIVAAVSFYFIDFQKRHEERERFDFDIYQAFAKQAETGTGEHKLGVSETMREYRRLYVRPDSQLDKLLIALDATVLKAGDVRALLSLKENAPKLADVTNDRNPTIAQAGQQIKESPYQALIEQLFSPEAQLRVRAYDEIKNRFGKDPTIIDNLIKYARANMDNENGVYNTVATLKDLSREITKLKKAEINAFCEDAQLIGDKTKKSAVFSEHGWNHRHEV